MKRFSSIALSEEKRAFLADIGEESASQLVSLAIGRSKKFKQWQQDIAMQNKKRANEPIPDVSEKPPVIDHHTTGGGKRNIRSAKGMS